MATEIEPQEEPQNPSDNVIDIATAPYYRALGRAREHASANPETGARALTLSRDMGVPADVVYQNIDLAEDDYKTLVVADILKKNEVLRDYIDSHPMGAVVSNNDYGNLDEATTATKKLGEKSFFENTKDVAMEMIDFLFHNGVNDIGPAMEDMFRKWGMSEEEIKVQLGGRMKNLRGRADVSAAALTIAPTITAPFLSAAFVPAAGAFRTGVSAPLEEFFGLPHEVTEMAVMVGMAGLGIHKMQGDYVKEQQYQDASRILARYAKEGKTPPYGGNELVDKVVKAQHDLDLKNLQEAEKAYQNTQTREQDWESLAQFARLHNEVGDRYITISAESVRKLYGDKVPEPNDGILGFVENIGQQLKLADVDGDIRVPLGDWLARIEPDVAKALRDDIRIRSGAPTNNEIKAAEQIKAMVEAYHGSPYEFDAFSLEKAGTGEGAWSYGYGIYTAEHPGTASTYKEAGASRKMSLPEFRAAEELKAFNGDTQKAIASLQRFKSRLQGGGAISREVDEAIKLIQEGKAKADTGNLYRVRIHANKEDMLDWDKPLGEQPALLEKLRPLVQPALDRMIEVRKRVLEKGTYGTPGSKYAKPLKPSEIEMLSAPPRQLEELTGGEAYKMAGLPAITHQEGYQRSSKLLYEAGIPGIKYLDQGSRHPVQVILRDLDIPETLEFKTLKEAQDWVNNTPIMPGRPKPEIIESQQTHNIVIFDDKLVEITHRNDIEILRSSYGLDRATLKSASKYPQPEPEPTRGYTFKGNVLGDNYELNIVPRREMVKLEKEMFDHAVEIVRRLTDDRIVNVRAADRIALKGKEVLGAAITSEHILPVIAFALETRPKVSAGDKRPVTAIYNSVIRHETVHFLKAMGLINDAEWAALTKAATTKNKEGKDWLDKHDIRNRYKERKLSEADLIEEAIVEEFGEWGYWRDEGMKQVKEYDKFVQHALDKVWTFMEGLYKGIKDYFGHDPAVEDIFQKIESGEVGKRKTEWEAATGFKESAPPAGESPWEKMVRPFKEGVGEGLSKGQYEHYMRLIEKLNKQDKDWLLKKVQKEQERIASKEYKDTWNETRKKVAEEMGQRPEFLFDEYMSRKDAVRLDPKTVPPEALKVLPKQYFNAKTGVPLEDYAKVFGYTDPKLFMERVTAMAAERIVSGQRPADFRRSMIDRETDRLMQLRKEGKNENLLQEAMDHVLSETQLELLNEDFTRMAMEHGQGPPLSKAQIHDWMLENFYNLPARMVDREDFMAQALRAVNKAEDALRRAVGTQDSKLVAQALRHKQDQILALTQAKEALKLERVKERLIPQLERLSAREQPGMDLDYVNQIHALMRRLDIPVERTTQDIVKEIEASSFKTLNDFVRNKKQMMREIDVADFLLDPEWKKKAEDFTVGELLDFNETIKSLAKNAREEKKIYKAGAAADFDEVKGELIQSIKDTFHDKPIKYNAKGERTGIGKMFDTLGIRSAFVGMLQMEAILHRWDRGNWRGVWSQYVFRDLADAGNVANAMEAKYGKMFRELKSPKGLYDAVPDSPFKDPKFGTRIDMTRENMLAVMLNMGNRSNFDKMAKGWMVDPKEVIDWVNKHATKDDWDWVQGVGDIFERLKAENDDMRRRIGHLPAEDVIITPVQTPHGEYRGWYSPMDYHEIFKLETRHEMGPNVLEQPGYFRPSTPSGFTKKRTGYAAPTSMDYNMIPVRIKQVIHDTAYRPAVLNASKVFYDPQIRNTITRYAGKEFTDLLIPFLQDVANFTSLRPEAMVGLKAASDFIRQNLITTLVGMNPGTMMKHGASAAVNSLYEVGPLNFTKEMLTLLMGSETTAKNNWQYAMDKSLELQRRHRHFSETMSGSAEKGLYGRGLDPGLMGVPRSLGNVRSVKEGVMALREYSSYYGSLPVSMVDLVSAVPTWLAKYKMEIKAGRNEGDAVAAADRAVRRAHGSSAITNKSHLVRQAGALGSWFTGLYNFFSHVYSRQYEIKWRAGEALHLVKEGEYKEAMGQAKIAAAMTASYVVALAVIEELVTPAPHKEDDSTMKTWGKALGFTMGASVLGLREISGALVHDRPASGGMIGTLFSTLQQEVNDLTSKQGPMSEARASRTLQHSITAFATLTGIGWAQMGKTARFAYDVHIGREYAQGPWGWLVGGRFGTLKHHEPTYKDWKKATFPRGMQPILP